MDPDGNVSAPVFYDPEVLRRSFESGAISEETYRSLLSASKDHQARKDECQHLLSSGRYPFERSLEDMGRDLELSLIDGSQYSMFSWYAENRIQMDREGTETSFKLKLSTWGLKIMGRYDLCEYSMNRDENFYTKRFYCVNGTLFEGCGNFKAPDDAFRHEITEERSILLFRFLSELKAMGILGGNYRESPFNCDFYDLYTRYSDGPMLHTKGTSEYPAFIRMILYLLDAKDC